jgi:hypothetical protein
MKVEPRVSEEELNNDPEFGKKLAVFQRRCDQMKRDIRAKFAHSVHESGHIMYFRRLGWDVEELFGPYMEYHDGELCHVLGAVRPRRDFDIPESLYTDAAKAWIAGFVLVELITGRPNEQVTIDGDLKGLPSELNTTPEQLQQIVETAKSRIRRDMQHPSFFPELEQAVSEYEKFRFGTDETWAWGWNEYRLDLRGERYQVGLCCTGYVGTLIENGCLTMLVGGVEYQPWDKIRDYDLEVVVGKGCKAGAVQVVERWNDMVRAATSSRN